MNRFIYYGKDEFGISRFKFQIFDLKYLTDYNKMSFSYKMLKDQSIVRDEENDEIDNWDDDIDIRPIGSHMLFIDTPCNLHVDLSDALKFYIKLYERNVELDFSCDGTKMVMRIRELKDISIENESIYIRFKNEEDR